MLPKAIFFVITKAINMTCNDSSLLFHVVFGSFDLNYTSIKQMNLVGSLCAASKYMNPKRGDIYQASY